MNLVKSPEQSLEEKLHSLVTMQDYGLSALDSHNVTVQVANNIKEGDFFFVPQLGPFRSAVRWAFNSKTGSVSEPLETESFYTPSF